jgi:hypothetical protein
MRFAMGVSVMSELTERDGALDLAIWRMTVKDYDKYRQSMPHDYSPSTDGKLAMNLLHEHLLNLEYDHMGTWIAYGVLANDTQDVQGIGPTPEIAICRAIVASKS